MQTSTGHESGTAAPHAAKWSWPLESVAQYARRPKHARTVTTHRLRDAAALALTGVLTLTGVGAGAAANQITSNVTAVDLEQVFIDHSHERPTIVVPEIETPNLPLNILVLGIDGRFGENGEYANDEVEGARADSTIVLHISADREHVSAISIPRDSIVNIPSCPTTTPGRTTRAAANTRFNAAFAMGYDLGGDVASGAICTLTTVESLTDVHLDGFVVLDFAGFQNMVEALGGVSLCIDEPISAPLAGNLSLDAGCHHLNSWDTLQLARARTGTGLGDGSDLTRIRRQQDVLRAIANQALSTNLLTGGPTLLRFISATSSSMTASANFASVPGLVSLAMSLGGISTDNIDFVMVPIATNPENRNTVVWTGAADELWRNVRYNTLYSAAGDVAAEVAGDSTAAAPASDS